MLTDLLDLLSVLVLLVVFTFRHLVGFWTMETTMNTELHRQLWEAEVVCVCSFTDIKVYKR